MKKITLLLAFVFGAPLAWGATFESVYTSVDPADCIMVDSSEFYDPIEIDFSDQECPSYGGYRVRISGSDLRYSLKLSFNGVDLPVRELSTFHEMGSDKIEWRYQRVKENGKTFVVYRALIYRLNYQDINEAGEPDEKTHLVVLRLNGTRSCVLGLIGESATMNEQARQIADDNQRSCSSDWAFRF